MFGCIQRTELAADRLVRLSLDSIDDAIVHLDEQGRIVWFNRPASQLLGLTEAHLRTCLASHTLIQAGEDSNAERLDLTAQLQRRTRLPPDAVLVLADGKLLGIEGQFVPVREPDLPPGTLVVLRDVTEQRRARRWIAFQTTHDSLTALLNRCEIEKRIAYAVQQAHAGGIAALLHVDLDRFKIINDTCGLQAGDEFLRRAGKALRNLLGNRHALARLGGDEFAILVPGYSAAQAFELAESIISTIRDIRFVWEQRPFRVTASVGIVQIDTDFPDWRQALALADAACFVAKEQGRARAWLARPDDERLRQRRAQMDWVARITGALEDDRFVLYRQRITPLARHLSRPHNEVLMRLREKDNVLAPPEQFIPAAERYGLMPAVDRWVVAAVLGYLGRLPTRHTDRTSVTALNISGTSLSDSDFVHFVSHALAQHQLAPGRLCFEITETAAATDFDAAIRFITAIRRLGCQVSLDDFGTGFSSFSYLKHFQVDYLKIDGGFVRNMDTDVINARLVESINHLGKALGVATIAEYAESAAVVEQLRELGVDYAQGNYIGRPQYWVG